MSDWWLAFKEWAKQFLITILDMLKDFFFWIFEQLLGLVLLILQGMGSLFDALNVAQYFSAIPPGVQWVMAQTGFGTAMGMITAAIVIRILLQLIPFTRLGS